MLRLRFGFVVIALVVSIFGARLVQLQGLDPHAYAAAATQEGLVEAVLPAKRGNIVDRNGEPFAKSVDGLMIVADPQMTQEKAPEIAKFLAAHLGIDYFNARVALSRTDTRFAYIARRVPSALAARVLARAAELGYKGLDTRVDALREYPARDVGANIVGFLASTDDQTDVDKPPTTYGAGFELSFEKMLAGTDGSEKYEVGGGNRIPLGENVTVKPKNGQDLTTTLDQDTQWYVQRALAQAVKESGGESGSAVVMDTRTGELLAVADYPTYDASSPGDSSGDSPIENTGAPSLRGPYEPGSVEKVLTMAALLDQKLVTPSTRLSVRDHIEVLGQPLGDYFSHGVLPVTLTGVLAKSLNVGTVMASRKISAPMLYRYLRAFGLGAPTGVGVTAESGGKLPDGALWNDLTKATVSYGQGLSVTSVQMAAAINTIANGGLYVSPSLVEGSATTDAGQVVGTDRTTTRRVVSEPVAHQTATMMERVLDPDQGVAPLAAVPGYRVAGKTGTAQTVDSGCRCYYRNKFNVSFAGFAPADDARFTVYVVVRGTGHGQGGGSVGGPLFAKIMSHLLRRYGVPPTNTPPSRLPICWDAC